MALNRGKTRSVKLAPKGLPTRLSNGFAQSAQTRVGKQSKYGPLKAKAPGQRTTPKALGG